MCEKCPTDKGWRGWIELPKLDSVAAKGVWVDLSHTLSRDMPRQPFFPQPAFNKFMSAPADPLNVTHLDMIAHIGTHVDSPRHVYNDGPAFEDIPLERLCGPGVVWHVNPDAQGLIGPRELEGALGLLERGDILLLNTGMHHRAFDNGYADHPSLSIEGAQWLIDHQVKLVGVDMPTPDLAHHRRASGFNFPVHRLLLAHGVLIAEHLTNLDRLSGQRVEVICSALNIKGGDGAPCRILARPL
ncbi:MAG: cyclase family protein [Burkholderiaceae bacterium]|nr:cyclase family protein [Burkholderiaceae bacterium]MCD8564547.1 cyclase family protein [Burkholderiaceae bacterium]